MRPIVKSAMLGLPLFGIARPRDRVLGATAPRAAAPPAGRDALDLPCAGPHRHERPATGLPPAPPQGQAAVAGEPA